MLFAMSMMCGMTWLVAAPVSSAPTKDLSIFSRISTGLPPGEKLRVDHLKDRYNVGAGTLREALSLLLSDALVVSEGQRDFHEALIGGCDSRWLRYLIGLLYRQSERYRHTVISHRSVARDVHAEHSAIYEAALARDVKRARAALEVHINLTFESIRKLLPELE